MKQNWTIEIYLNDSEISLELEGMTEAIDASLEKSIRLDNLEYTEKEIHKILDKAQENPTMFNIILPGKRRIMVPTEIISYVDLRLYKQDAKSDIIKEAESIVNGNKNNER